MGLEAVAKLSEIPEGGSKVVIVDGREVAVFRTESGLHAIDNICPHRGGPLAEGFVRGTTVTCPWHAWDFDVMNGKCLTVPECRVRAYPVRLAGDDVAVEVES